MIRILFSAACLLSSIFQPLWAQIEPIDYEKKNIDGNLHLGVKNLLPAPLRYQLWCDTISHEMDTVIQSGTGFVEVLVLPNFVENDTINIRDFVRVKAHVGDHRSQHNDEYRYRMPFGKGKAVTVMQQFKGSFSHNVPHSFYAVDFTMKIGTPVHAAREGKVVYYDNHFTEGGRDREKYMDKGNRIMILHDDGTIATYNHLNKDGVIVSLGQTVERGQHIGYSGNTGFSTKPHLHFVVRSGRLSVPIVFKGYQSIKKGKKYRVK